MKKTLILATLLSVMHHVANAQSFFDRLKIRESFQSEDTKPEPASVSYTKPESAASSYLIDGGLAFTIINSDQYSLRMFSEYHRNTLIDKEQKTLQAGLAAEFMTNKNYGAAGKHTRWVFTASADYNRDYLDSLHSLQASGEATILFSGRTGLLPNHYNRCFNNYLGVEYFPSVGVEDDYRIQTKHDSLNGNIFRPVLKIYVGLYPFSRFLDGRIEVFGSWNFKYDLIKNTNEDIDESHLLIKAGLNVVLVKQGNRFVKLGFSYNAGSDPLKGLKEQTYSLISFKVKI